MMSVSVSIYWEIQVLACTYSPVLSSWCLVDGIQEFMTSEPRHAQMNAQPREGEDRARAGQNKSLWMLWVLPPCFFLERAGSFASVSICDDACNYVQHGEARLCDSPFFLMTPAQGS